MVARPAAPLAAHPATPSSRPPPARWLSAAADELATPLLLLEADGRVAHANRAAREWLALQPHYRLDALGVLAPKDPRAGRAWRGALARVATEDTLAADDLPQLPGWRLRRLSAERGVAWPRLVLLRPLPEGE